MKLPSRLPQIAAAAALCLAGIGLLSALQQIAVALFALIPLAAGIGILRGQIWSAYGFALFEAAQLAIAPVLLSRTGNVSEAQLAVTLGLNLAFAILFFLAGRALAGSGGKGGGRLPWIVLACLGSIPFLFWQAFTIPSGGMEDTLLIGDRILTRVVPPVTPARGDILVFRYAIDRRQIFVKRVIGIPGDHIRIIDSVVYRNGAALVEPYAVHRFVSTGSYRDNFPGDPARSFLQPNTPEIKALGEMLQHNVANDEVIVPPHSYFVLGDNRDNSLDSRYWGFVRTSDVIGRAVLIYDSKETVAGGDRQAGLRGQRTRWKRVFRPL